MVGTSWEMTRSPPSSPLMGGITDTDRKRKRCPTSSPLVGGITETDQKRKRCRTRCPTSSPLVGGITETDQKRKRCRTSSSPARAITDTDRKRKRCRTSSSPAKGIPDTDRERKRCRTRCPPSCPARGIPDIHWKRKRRRTGPKPLCPDMLTSLPDQILGQILSLLPIMDVAAMQVLSKRMGRAFSLIARAGAITGSTWEMKRCRPSSSLVEGITDADRKRKMCGTSCPTSSNLVGRITDTEDQQSSRRCTSSKPLCPDRLTSLPDQILGQILSTLPTKDVAAMQVLSKRMGCAFSLITRVEMDDSYRRDSRKCPHLVERFPLFKSFVINVLQKLSVSDAEEPLTRFRLRLGGDKDTHYIGNDEGHQCDKACFPNLEPGLLNVWLSYPLSHSGLRELDLTFRTRNSDEYKLPPQLLDCRSLEFFRLDADIRFDRDDLPLICLPNLKRMQIYSVLFAEVDFLTRLVSSCPALEDLSIDDCDWGEYDRITISSHSLRRLVLCLLPVRDGVKRVDVVTIDTPNLLDLSFSAVLPSLYSVTHMNALIKAELYLCDWHSFNAETSFRSQLSLLNAITNVQHLSTRAIFLEALSLAAELKDHRPVFHNLRTITLPNYSRHQCWRWDIVLPFILHSSPLLETLDFPWGPFEYTCPIHAVKRTPTVWGAPWSPSPDDIPIDKEIVDMETEGWRTNTLPSSCVAHLKRIEFGYCYGIARELNMLKFLLGKAFALEEVVLCLFKDVKHGCGCRVDDTNFEEFVSKLKELPMASNPSIIVRR